MNIMYYILLCMFKFFHLKRFLKININLQLLPTDVNPNSYTWHTSLFFHWCPVPCLDPHTGSTAPGITPWCQCSGMASYRNSTQFFSLTTYKGVNTQLRCPLHWKSSLTLEILPGFPQHPEETPTAILRVAMVYSPPSFSCLSKSSSGQGWPHPSVHSRLALCWDKASTEESFKFLRTSEKRPQTDRNWFKHKCMQSSSPSPTLT